MLYQVMYKDTPLRVALTYEEALSFLEERFPSLNEAERKEKGFTMQSYKNPKVFNIDEFERQMQNE